MSKNSKINKKIQDKDIKNKYEDLYKQKQSRVRSSGKGLGVEKGRLLSFAIILVEQKYLTFKRVYMNSFYFKGWIVYGPEIFALKAK